MPDTHQARNARPEPGQVSRSARWTAAALCWVALSSLPGCTRSGPSSSLPPELPKELLDVLPEGEKRPVEVVMASPRGSLTTLDPHAVIAISFNQPMVPLRPVSLDESIDFVEISPPLEGRFRWKGSATLTFEPKAPLPYATRYKVRLKSGLKSWSGQALAAPFEFDFITPTVAVERALPPAGSESLGVSDPIYLHFNQPISLEALKGNLVLDQGGVETPVDLRAYTDDDRKAESKAAPLQSVYGLPEDAGGVVTSLESALVASPARPLKPGQATRLLLKKGTHGSGGGTEVSEQDQALAYVTRPVFALDPQAPTSHNPEDGFTLQFTSPVNASRLRKLLTVTPAIDLPEFEGEGASTEVYLGGEPQPGTTYHVKIGEGLTDEFGAAYQGAREFTYVTGDYRPSLQGPEGAGVLELQGPRSLPYGARNLGSVEGSYRKVTPAEAIALQQSDKPGLWSSDPFVPPGGWTHTENLGATSKLNQVEQRDLKLPGGGLYYVEARGDSERRRSLVSVSDVGVTAKFSAQSAFFYVTSLDKVTPLEGAAITLYDNSGREIWRGKSDAQGFCQSPGWAALGLRKTEEWNTPDLWAHVTSGASETLVHSNSSNSIQPWLFGLDSVGNENARRFGASAFAERGVYKPGEAVQLKGSLRELKDGKWKLPDTDRVHFKLIDSRDKEVTQGDLPVNRFGGFAQTLKLKPGAPTGTYRVEYYLSPELQTRLNSKEMIQSASFGVEMFKPAQFEVTATTDKPYYVVGDKARVQAKGWYLFGAPMNDRPVSWSARLEPSDLRPEGLDGWDFGRSWDSEAQDESQTLTSGEGKLDAQGLASQELQLDKIPYKGSAQLVIEELVTSPNRQQLAGRVSVPLHRGEFQLGLRAASSFVGGADGQQVKLVALTPDRHLKGDVPVKVEVLRRQYNSVRKAGVGGAWEWVSEARDERISGAELKTSADGSVAVQLQPAGAGFYVVRASASDGRNNQVVSETTFYASGEGTAAWQRRDQDQVELVADKKSYKPGDTAHILIKSPFAETRALVTLEREGVMERRVVELKGNAPVLDVPLTAEHLPNVYFSVMLLRGRSGPPSYGPDGQDTAKPSFKVGYVNLPVEPAERKLQVSVKTDKQRYAPGEQVQADFEVRDAAGQPVVAELCVAVPDQGVLALTNYQLPDWFAFFYGPRPLAVTTMESRLDVIGQRSYGSKGANSGGGGGFDADLSARGDFRYTAFWNPSLVSDAGGHAHVSFKLPDNLSTFRIMASAQTEASQFGAAESRIEVQKALMLQPSTPDFARVGDKFKAGVVVRNQSAGSLEVDLEATSSQASALAITGKAQHVSLAAGKEQEVLWDVQATAAAPVQLRFSARGGELKDALVLPLVVQQPRSLENVASSGSTTSSATVEMVVPSPMLAGSGMMRVALSSSALVGLAAPLDRVLGLTAVSLEERLSQMRAAVAADTLNRRFQLGKLPTPQIEGWLADLSRYQSGDEGFKSYPESERPDPYLSAYALDTLNLLKSSGHKPDAALLTSASTALQTFLNSQDPLHEQLTARCLALDALSRTSFAGMPYFNNLLRRRNELPLEARVYLLRAGRNLKAAPDDLQTLEQDLGNALKLEAATAYFADPVKPTEGWSFTSRNGLTALCLSALLQSPRPFPHAEKVLAYLMEARTPAGDWGDTLSDTRVLEALTLYAQEREQAAPDMRSEVKLAGKKLLAASFQGRKPEVKVGVAAVAASAQKLPLQITKQGSGRLYYDARLSYVAQGAPPPRDEGLAVLKKISDVDGKHFPAQLQAGSTYMVTLTVVSPRDRRFVVVNDPVPAGCEVVQTDFETESAEMARILQAASAGRDGSSTFTHFEKAGDRVALFADGLSAGEHTFSYLVRANQPGNFTLPGTRAEEIYHPEVFGTTGARQVEIR